MFKTMVIPDKNDRFGLDNTNLTVNRIKSILNSSITSDGASNL